MSRRKASGLLRLLRVVPNRRNCRWNYDEAAEETLRQFVRTTGSFSNWFLSLILILAFSYWTEMPVLMTKFGGFEWNLPHFAICLHYYLTTGHLKEVAVVLWFQIDVGWCFWNIVLEIRNLCNILFRYAKLTNWIGRFWRIYWLILSSPRIAHSASPSSWPSFLSANQSWRKNFWKIRRWLPTSSTSRLCRLSSRDWARKRSTWRPDFCTRAPSPSTSRTVSTLNCSKVPWRLQKLSLNKLKSKNSENVNIGSMKSWDK